MVAMLSFYKPGDSSKMRRLGGMDVDCWSMMMVVMLNRGLCFKVTLLMELQVDVTE